MGFPRIDLASALCKFFAGGLPAEPLTRAWWLGMAIFFLFGSVLSPYLFACAYHGLLGNSWWRGIEWGVFVWTFGGVAVMTAMGLGFDEAHFSHPFSSFFSSLAGHVVYGALLGGIARRVLVHLKAGQGKHA